MPGRKRTTPPRLVDDGRGLRISTPGDRIGDAAAHLVVTPPAPVSRFADDGEGLLVTAPDALTAAGTPPEGEPTEHTPDPWQEQRLDAAADLLRWERKLEAGAARALSAWTAVCATAVLEDRYLTAAPGDGLPPDPNAIPPLRSVWQQIAGTHIVRLVSDLLGEVFGRYLREEHVVSARPWQEQYLEDVSNRLVSVADSTFDVVRDVVQDGIDQGASIPTIRDNVQDALDAGGEVSWANRARTIARTETIGAYNGGHLAAWEVLEDLTGEAVDKVWLATIDPRTRDSHFRADGQRRELGDPFDVGSASLAFPGDPTGPAGEVINCLPDGDTPILTATGLRPIRDVLPGDLVVTHRGRLRPVLRLSHRRAAAEIVTVGLADGRRLRLTANHPVRTEQGWMVAGELVPGVLVSTATSVEHLDGLVGPFLLAVDRAGVGAAATANPDRHGQHLPRLLALDDEVGQHPCQDGACSAVRHLPPADRCPALPGGPAVVAGTDAGDLPAELDQPSVAVRDQQALLEGDRDGLSAGPVAGDGDDALAVDQGGEVGGCDGLHASIVSQPVVTCSRVAVSDVDLWNFAVAEDESYVAAGIAVHNCRCTMLELDRDDDTPDTSERGFRDAGDVQAEIDRRAAQDPPVVRAYDQPADGLTAAAKKPADPAPTLRPPAAFVAAQDARFQASYTSDRDELLAAAGDEAVVDPGFLAELLGRGLTAAGGFGGLGKGGGYFDPNQKRDDHGRWTVHGSGISITVKDSKGRDAGAVDASFADPTEALARVTWEHELTGSDGNTYRSVVFDTYAESGGRRTARLRLLDSDGNIVGVGTRSVRQSSRGPEVHHDKLTVYDTHQGLGLATDLNRKAEEVYRAAGATHVTVDAASNPRTGFVGGYVWARRGFGWDAAGGPHKIAGQLRAQLAVAGLTASPDLLGVINRLDNATTDNLPHLPTPFEVSELRQGDLPLGKLALLQESWSGIRWLPAPEPADGGAATAKADDKLKKAGGAATTSPSPVLTGADADRSLAGIDGGDLSDDELEALMDYRLNGYLTYNAHLRGTFTDPHTGDPLPPASAMDLASIADLRAVADRHRLPAPVEVYRGLTRADRVLPPRGEAVGTVLTDPGFASTTTDRDIAEAFSEYDGTGGALLRITVPAGHPGIPMEALSGGGGDAPDEVAEERELVLPPGSSFRITGEERGAGGVRVLTAEVLPYGGEEGLAAQEAAVTVRAPRAPSTADPARLTGAQKKALGWIADPSGPAPRTDVLRRLADAGLITEPPRGWDWDKSTLTDDGRAALGLDPEPTTVGPAPLSGDDAHRAAQSALTRDLTAGERRALDAYTGADASTINAHLRGDGSGDPARHQAMASDLAGLAYASPLPEPIRVYRGLHNASSFLDDENLTGSTLTDPGFVSTTTDAGVANLYALDVYGEDRGPEEAVVLDLAVPAGYPVVPVDQALVGHGRDAGQSYLAFQKEVILPPGAAYRVTSDTVNADGVRVLTADVLPPGTPADPAPTGNADTTPEAPANPAPADVVRGVTAGDELLSSMVTEDLDGDAFMALSSYILTGYNDANDHLRGLGDPAVATHKDVLYEIDHLRAIAAKHPLPKPVEVWRGMSRSNLVLPPDGQAVGSVVTDPGFLSVSLDRNIADGFVVEADEPALFKLTVPAGHPVVPVDRLIVGDLEDDLAPAGEREFEVILPPGSSFRITGDERDAKGVRVITGEVVPYLDLDGDVVPQFRPSRADDVAEAAVDAAAPDDDRPASSAFRVIGEPADGDAWLRDNFDPKALSKPEKEAVGYWTNGASYRQVNELLRTGSLEMKVMTDRGRFEFDPAAGYERRVEPAVYETRTVHSTDDIRALSALDHSGRSHTLDRLANQIDNLPGALDKHRTPEDLTLYRVAAMPELAAASREELLGSTITDRGFVATSTSEKSAVLVTTEALGVSGDVVLFEVRTPAGTPYATPELSFGTVNGQKLGGYTAVQEVLLNPSAFRVVDVLDDTVDTSGLSLKNGAKVKADAKAKRPPVAVRRIVVERIGDAETLETPPAPEAPAVDAPTPDAAPAPLDLSGLSWKDLRREGSGRLTGSVSPEMRSWGHKLHNRIAAAEVNNLGTPEGQRLADDLLASTLGSVRDEIARAKALRGGTDWDVERVDAALDQIQVRLDARRAAYPPAPAPKPTADPDAPAATPASPLPPVKLTAARLSALEHYAAPLAERSGPTPNYSVYMPLLRAGLIERLDGGKYVVTDAGRAALADAPAPDAPSVPADQPRDVLPLTGEAAYAALPRLPEGASLDLRLAVADYQGAGFAPLNQGLRGGDEMDRAQNKLRDRLDAAFAATEPLGQPVTVYRGTGSASAIFGADPLAPGTVLSDRAFLSTSTDPDVAGKFIMLTSDPAVLEVRVPAGARAIAVLGDEGYEAEALLPRDSQLRVVSEEVRRTIPPLFQDAYDKLAAKAKRGDWPEGELERVARQQGTVVDARYIVAELVPAGDTRDASPEAPAAPAVDAPAADVPEAPAAPAADERDNAADLAAAEKKAAAAARRAAKKAEKQRVDEEAALAADLTKRTDDAGHPLALSYDYLSGLDEDGLEDLEVHLITGVANGDPLDERRLEDLVAYNEAQRAQDRIAADGDDDVAITRGINDWLEANGRPGLTHPAVGGSGSSDVVGIPTMKEVRAEYAEFLHQQLLAAEAATRGHMLNAAGRRRRDAGNLDHFAMFSSPRGVADVMQYASEELLDWFTENRRIAWAEFYYERTKAPGYAEKAAKARGISVAIDRDRNALEHIKVSKKAYRAAAVGVVTAAAAAPAEPSAPSRRQLEAYTGGLAAHADGRPLTDCPHPPSLDGTGDAEGLFVLWVRGYVAGKRAAALARRVAEGLVRDPALDRLGWAGGDVTVVAPPAVDPAPRFVALDGELEVAGPSGLTASPAPTGQTVTAAGSGPGDPSAPEGPPMPRTWRSAPHLAPFGTSTGDGRIFKVGSLEARELPLPLLFQPSSGFGHDGSVVVGRILAVNFTDAGIEASGDYLDVDPAKAPDLSKAVEQAVALTESGLGHVSVDLSDVVGELVDEDGNAVNMEDLFDAWDKGEEPVVLEQVSEGKLIACTQVATPAFEGAKIELTAAAAPVDVDGEAALEDASGAAITVGAVVDVEGDDGTVRGRVTAVDEDGDEVTVQPTDADGADAGDPLVVSSAAVTVVTAAPAPADEEDQAEEALLAAAGPLRPPAAWFEDPKLTTPTAITITEDGRVFGHAALWGACHVGFSNTCVTPPSSPSGYSFFHTGEVVTDDGSRVAVGNLTLGGKHADVRLAYRNAIEHYDERGAGTAVVRCYEDEFGIAFAGAVTPGTTEEQLYDMRRSPVSGDWRRVGGQLELIGVLSVNSPGFPTPRFATDEAGRTALTAAPSVRPMSEDAIVAAAGGRPARGLSQDELVARVAARVRTDLAAEQAREYARAERRRRLAGLATSIKADPRARMQALSARVLVPARRDRMAELAASVTR